MNGWWTEHVSNHLHHPTLDVGILWTLSAELARLILYGMQDAFDFWSW